MQYVLGIDLGTTHTALASAEVGARVSPPAQVPLVQYASPRTTVRSGLLPSCLFVATTEGELADFPPLFSSAGSLQKRADLVIGEYAQQIASDRPGCVVRSAKSWLGQRSVDPESAFLPWGSDELSADKRLSPVAASQYLIEHAVRSWEKQTGQSAADLKTVITVPASFDEVSQELTLEAAQRAGLKRAVLLEEPQAAFYAWLDNQGSATERARRLFELFPTLKQRDITLLVCDVGGGTTDFSLFRIQAPLAGQRIPRIHRVAVSDHLLLGGDNLDLALADLAEKEFTRENTLLDPAQRLSLQIAARAVKERVLADEALPDELRFSVAGRSSNLFASALSVGISSAKLLEAVLEGFFPRVDRAERPHHRPHGLRQIGLNYAEDPAITRHLAHFLALQPPVDAVLFNGGTLIPTKIRERLLESIGAWQNVSPIELKNPDLTSAVALGAASFARLDRESTLRIQAGSPRAILVELDSGAKHRSHGRRPLLCVLPKGAQPGTVRRLAGAPLGLKLRVGIPVSFSLFTDRDSESVTEGALVDGEKLSLHPLAPMQTSLSGEPNSLIAVDLEAQISETGLLELHCVQTDAADKKRWKLRFNLRRDTAELPPNVSSEAAPDPELVEAKERILAAFGKKKTSEHPADPRALRRALEQTFRSPLDEWELPRLRSLADLLFSGSRGRSPEHEWTWFQLIGFFMRPGFGATLDSWRMDRLWPIFDLPLVHPTAPGIDAQRWILWRRVAGGLSRERQEHLLRNARVVMSRKVLTTPEVLLTAGALERAEPTSRIALGEILLRWLERKTPSIEGQCLWSLARLANRTPLYAGVGSILPRRMIEEWVERVLALKFRETTPNYVLFLSQASRCTGDSAIDLDLEVRTRVGEALRGMGVPQKTIDVLFVPEVKTAEGQAEVFGEKIPPGFKLTSYEALYNVNEMPA